MAKLPVIGTRAHGGMTPQACVELAKLAEANGLASLWFAENPFTRGILPAVSACAVATEKLKLGIGVWNPYNRHPTLMAMEIGALDELSGSRIALGIGSGIGSAVEKMGLSYAKPLGAIRDAVNIVRGMLRGDTVTYAGNVFSAAGAKLEHAVPRPELPIYVAAVGDQALRVCAQVSDGLMISNMCPPGYTSRALGIVHEAATKAGRPMLSTVIQYAPCIIQRDRAAARTAVKQTIGNLLATYWTLYAQWPATREALLRESGIPEAEFIASVQSIQSGAKPSEVLDDRFVDAYSLAGNLDDFWAGAERFGQAGVTELVVTFVGSRPAEEIAYLGSSLNGERLSSQER
jgi:5,10-methylenetetrahydromethanopterin reductase